MAGGITFKDVNFCYLIHICVHFIFLKIYLQSHNCNSLKLKLTNYVVYLLDLVGTSLGG